MAPSVQGEAPVFSRLRSAAARGALSHALLFTGPGDRTAAARFAAAHCDELEQIAASVIEEAGYFYPVEASVGPCLFPDKTYDDLCFPAGVYNALRVEIGQAQGQNWWCVLYPPLCFTEEGSATVPENSREQ